MGSADEHRIHAEEQREMITRNVEFEAVPATGPIDTETAQERPILGIHVSGSRAPLYFARVWRADEIEGYRQLARCLGPDQPVYLIAPPPESSRADYRATVDSWSNHLLAALRELGASGPLFLGGWSLGGVIALEAARKLEAAGEKISLVCLIDSWIPRKHAKGSRSFPRKLLELYEKLRSRPAGDRWEVLRGPILWRLSEMRRRGLGRLARLGGIPGQPTLTEDRGAGADPLRRAVFVAYLKYEPQPTELPVALYWCDESRSSVGEATLGWYRLLRGPFESRRVPGGHFDLFQEPQVLAHHLRRSIDHASEG